MRNVARSLRSALLTTACVAAFPGTATAVALDVFTDTDGSTCTVQSIDTIGITTKATGSIPAGQLLAVANASCVKPGRSPTKRSFLYTLPSFLARPTSRTSLPPADAGVGSDATLFAVLLLTDPYVVGLGETRNPAFFDPYQAFRYDIGAGTTLGLGSLAGANGTSAAYGGAVDGSVVVGTSTVNDALNPDPIHAFRWTPALGMQDLGAMMPGGSSDARAASADGSIVVGGAFVAPGTQQAFRWTLSNAATGAGSFASLGAATKIALAVSGDGNVVVGKGSNDQAFRWTAAGGVQDLGTLPGLAQAQATGVSDDGQVVVGISDSLVIVNFPAPLDPTTTQRAFRWTAATGMQYLGDLLAAAGVDMTGVTLLSANSVSADGSYIAGSALVPGSSDPVGYAVRYRDAANGVATPTATVLSFNVSTTPGLQLSAGTAGGSVVAGQSAQVELNLALTGGFTGSVGFACQNLPAYATCSFAPATLDAAGSSTLTIATQGGTAAAALGGLMGLGGLGLAALPWRRGRRVALPLLAAAALASCGDDGTPTTPPGTYAIDIVATGTGGATARTTYTLTVR